MTEKTPRLPFLRIFLVALLGIVAMGLQAFLGFVLLLTSFSKPVDPADAAALSLTKVIVGGFWIASLVGLTWAWLKASPLVLVPPIAAWILYLALSGVVPSYLSIAD